MCAAYAFVTPFCPQRETFVCLLSASAMLRILYALGVRVFRRIVVIRIYINSKRIMISLLWLWFSRVIFYIEYATALEWFASLGPDAMQQDALQIIYIYFLFCVLRQSIVCFKKILVHRFDSYDFQMFNDSLSLSGSEFIHCMTKMFRHSHKTHVNVNQYDANKMNIPLIELKNGLFPFVSFFASLRLFWFLLCFTGVMI